MRTRHALLPLLMVLAGCKDAAGPDDGDYQSLRASFVVPAGFTPASPAGPCSTDAHLKCWTTTALPAAAARAAASGLGADFKVTDTTWCTSAHWAQQRAAWGEAHTPCTIRGTWQALQVSVEAIAFPDSAKSTPGHLVFPPTVVSISAQP